MEDSIETVQLFEHVAQTRFRTLRLRVIPSVGSTLATSCLPPADADRRRIYRQRRYQGAATLGTASLSHFVSVYGGSTIPSFLALHRLGRFDPASENFNRRFAPSTSHNASRESHAIRGRPRRGPVIRGTGGIRKLRGVGSSRRKRGGIRIVYFYHAGPEFIYLPTANARADREDLIPADAGALSRLAAAIKKGTKGP